MPGMQFQDIITLMEKSTTQKFVHASLWAAVNSYGFFVINFIGQILLAKLLIPEDYGLYAFLLGVVEICIMFLGFSNTSGFINSAGTQNDYDACFKLNIISSILLFLIGVLGCIFSFIKTHSVDDGLLFLLLCVSQGFLLFSYVFMAPLQKNLDYKKVSFYNGICSSISLLVGIIFAKCHFSYWSLGLRDLLNYVLLFYLSYRICPMQTSRKLLQSHHREQLIFNVQTSFSRAMEILYYRFSDILIKITMGKFILGNFYQARSLSYIPIKIMAPFTHQVLFSFFSSIKHDKTLITDRLNWINYIATRLFLPFVFFVILFGKTVFVFIYGAKWVLAGSYFEYFSLWMPIASLFSAALSTSYSLGKQWIGSAGFIIAALSFILGIIFFRHLCAPPVFFTIGLTLGYVFLIAQLRKIGVMLRVVDIFFWPLVILGVAILAHLNFDFLFSIAVFLILYAALLWTERKKIWMLYQKIRGR